MFATVSSVEPHEIERLRRSVVMAADTSALTKPQALAMLAELATIHERDARFRAILGQLRPLLDELGRPSAARSLKLKAWRFTQERSTRVVTVSK